MSDEKQTMQPEWSYLVDAEEIESKPVKLNVSPDEDERINLAKRLDVLSLNGLEAMLSIKKDEGSPVVHVAGEFKADVTQSCVVTTDPVQSHIEDSFEAWFIDAEQTVPLAKARQEKLLKKGQTEVPMLEEYDDPEPMVNGKIDVGELIAQHLALSINPYPHAEGVHYELGDDDPSVQSSLSFKNPFAALKEWRDKQK